MQTFNIKSFRSPCLNMRLLPDFKLYKGSEQLVTIKVDFHSNPNNCQPLLLGPQKIAQSLFNFELYLFTNLSMEGHTLILFYFNLNNLRPRGGRV